MEELVYYGIRFFLAIDTFFYLYIHSRQQNNLLYDIVENNDIDYTKEITWTTDAYCMENYDRIAKRIEQDTKCIDIELSIQCFVSEYLSVDFSQILFFTDIIKNNK